MRELIVSDIHMHPFKQFAKIEPGGYNSRLVLIAQALKEAIDVAYLANSRTMYIAGDTFHIRGSVKSSALELFYQCLIYAMDKGMDVIILVGNHDMENYKYGISSVGALHGLKHNGKMVQVISTPQIVYAPTSGHKVLGIPYIHDVYEFKRVFENAVNGQNPEIILLHQGVDDFRETLSLPETKITAQYLRSVTNSQIFVGHYHSHRRSDGVCSVGALTAHTFGDEGLPRGYIIYNTDDRSISHHQTSHPEFISYEINSESDIKAMAPEGKFVRVKSEKKALLDKATEKCMQHGALGVLGRLVKTFETTHRKVITVTTPVGIVSDFIDLSEKFQPFKDVLLDKYKIICGR